MHVEFDSKDQVRAFYWPTLGRIQETFNIYVEAFYRFNECTSEALLFLWYLSIFV